MPTIMPVSPELEPLQEVLQRALARVEARLDRQLRSDLPPVQRLIEHAEQYRGKMIRPIMAVLSGLATEASAAGQPRDDHVREAHVVVAGVCELIHLATLVHDDVLDEADTRRKAPTVNRLRGNEAAVILGDYLFSAAYNLCSQLDSQSTALLVAKVGMTLCAGELLQLHNRENFSLDEPTYYTIVQRKTASLIAVACRLGAVHAGADAALADRFESFGNAIGIAFQIQDDLLDLTGQQSVVGKSLGKDLEKGKLTLPLIHHLASADPASRGRTLALLESAAMQGHASELGPSLVTALQSTGSIDYARRSAERFVQQAKDALGGLHDSPARRLMLQLADAVVTRAF
jgi:octaprenyl-diphosphate synthase